jgi:hypothetical protein
VGLGWFITLVEKGALVFPHDVHAVALDGDHGM